jgi:hypothetical protein
VSAARVFRRDHPFSMTLDRTVPRDDGRPPPFERRANETRGTPELGAPSRRRK